jgi:hypothetical protein
LSPWLSEGGVSLHYQVFLYLQVLDFMTTLVGLRIGLQEISPFIRQIMQFDTAFGLAASKLVAVGLGGFCIWSHRDHVIRWINYWYAALVIWNLCIILAVRPVL